MKKILTFIILSFFLMTNSCYAFSELYYFKNIKTSEVEPLVNLYLQNNNFNIIKQNPYYAVSNTNNDSAVIILQQSGENMFYYYMADKNTKVNKSIIKEIKNKNIVCEQSFNNNIIAIYDDIAADLVKNTGNPMQYTFSDETPATQIQTQMPAETSQKIYSGYIAQLQSGTKFNVYLQNAINTATASQGDSVIAVMQDNLIYNGNIVIPQGSLVYGTLVKARNATYGSLNGKIVINFNKIVTPENMIYDISTEKIDFAVSNEGKISESAKSAVSSAAVGALLGLLFGLLSDNGHAARSAAIGAGIGAGSSVIYSTAEKGVDAEIPSFTEIELTLTSPLTVNITR